MFMRAALYADAADEVALTAHSDPIEDRFEGLCQTNVAAAADRC
jgi:hypothetical protein